MANCRLQPAQGISRLWSAGTVECLSGLAPEDFQKRMDADVEHFAAGVGMRSGFVHWGDGDRFMLYARYKLMPMGQPIAGMVLYGALEPIEGGGTRISGPIRVGTLWLAAAYMIWPGAVLAAAIAFLVSGIQSGQPVVVIFSPCFLLWAGLLFFIVRGVAGGSTNALLHLLERLAEPP